MVSKFLTLLLSEPSLNEVIHRVTFLDFNGGIAFAEMLYRTNLLFLVGGGTNPKFPPNKVVVWDDNQQKCLGEMSYKTNILAVKVRFDA